MESILNPFSPGNPPAAAAPARPPRPSLSPRILKRPARSSPAVEDPARPGGHESRRVLTPKSPGRRAASLGTHRTPPGEGRVYTAEPGPRADSDIPPLPAPLAMTRTGSHPSTGTPSRLEPRRPSVGRAYPLAPASTGPSQSASPSTSHSSYSQLSQTSPVVAYGGPPPAPTLYGAPPAPPRAEPPRAPGPPLETHYDVGRSSYQMTLDTESGPMIVPVEVDVQQASRMADEKRKRNAGASARFRARRKEKEKEANQTIESLQKALRELTDERDFYQGERNFYREFVGRTLGPGQIPLRPPSPSTRRLVPPAPPPGQPPGNPPPHWPTATAEYSMRSQRRRTDEYQAPFAGLSMSPMTPSQPPHFGQPFPPLSAPPPPPSAPLQPPLPESRQPSTTTTAAAAATATSTPSRPPPPPPDRSAGPPPPPSAGPPPPDRPASYDPLRRDSLDRSWHPR